MSEQLVIAILGVGGSLLGAFLGYSLGERSEKNRQALSARSEMLKTVEEWLAGAERIIQIISDTLLTVTAGSPLAPSYNLEDRKKAGQFMAENTNRVLGILISNALRTRRTEKPSIQLADRIGFLDNQVKYVLLPMDTEILDRSLSGTLTNDFVASVLTFKLSLEGQIREAHALIAQMKTAVG